MTRLIGYLQTGFAILLYLLSAVTFIDYMYSLTIRDTVTAVENAFGTLVILIFMLVLAKFTLAAGKKKLAVVDGHNDTGISVNTPPHNEIDPGQTGAGKESEK
jgi:hypothetical protein